MKQNTVSKETTRKLELTILASEYVEHNNCIVLMKFILFDCQEIII